MHINVRVRDEAPVRTADHLKRREMVVHRSLQQNVHLPIAEFRNSK